MSRLSACILILGCGLSMADPIKPKVEGSSKKFFGKDNVKDDSPGPHYLDFNHPYPAVMDSQDFDRDFVEDQNVDKGEWAAQMEYDILRKKLRQAERDLVDLKTKMEAEEAEMKRSKVVWDAAVDKVTEATEATTAAQKVEDAEAKDVADGKSNVKTDATAVQNEMTQLEKCKKNLEDAKQVLKDLQAKQVEMDRKWAEQNAAAIKAKKEKEEAAAKAKAKALKDKEEAAKALVERLKKEAEELAAKQKKDLQEEHDRLKAEEQKRVDGLNKKLQERKDEAAAAVVKATKEAKALKEKHTEKKALVTEEDKKREAEIEELKAEIAAAKITLEKTEATWETKLAKVKSEHDDAWKAFIEKENSIDETQGALETARQNLKKYRRAPHVDQDGGVYNDSESSAVAWRLSALVVAALVGTFAC